MPGRVTVNKKNGLRCTIIKDRDSFGYSSADPMFVAAVSVVLRDEHAEVGASNRG